MNKLIVLNHQPTVPPFMLSALKVAVDRFDEVIYVNNGMPTNIDVVPQGRLIKFVALPRSRKSIAFIYSVFEFIKPKVLHLFIKGIINKGWSLHYFKVFFSHLLYYWFSSPTIKALLNKKKEKDRIYILSVWYGAEAYCISRIKHKEQDIISVSLAHSFEIFTSRDPHIQYYFNDYKLNNLNAVFFISKQGYDSFFSEIPSAKQYVQKANIVYLGSYKERNILNPSWNSDSFSICTCSRIIPLKRLDVLCEALRLWDVCPILWTLIGFGEDEEKLKSLAEVIQTENPKVKIVFKGRLQNNEVKAYYSQSHVDLFVNLSTIEGLPISIMEALSYGIPVIATNVGGTREIVNDEVGILLPAEITPQIVREALTDYYLKSNNDKARYRLNAFEIWEKRFMADNNFGRLYDIIMNL